jgi:hypothetical protein
MSQGFLIRKDRDFIGYLHQKIDGRLEAPHLKALQKQWLINGDKQFDLIIQS